MKKFFLILLALSILAPSVTFAAETGGYPASTGGGGTVTLENPLGADVTTFEKLITKVLDAAFIIGLPIAVLFIVIAGFRFVWARGKPAELEKAKKNLLWTVVGIGVFFGAWTLARIIEATISALKIGGS